MEFKTHKSKSAKRKSQAVGLPEPEVIDPTVSDKLEVDFGDNSEEKFLKRQLRRAQLDLAVRGDAEAQRKYYVPEPSDLERVTHEYYNYLNAIMTPGGAEAPRTEVKLLMKTFNTRSILNLAGALAELKIKEQEKAELSKWWTADGAHMIGLANTALGGRARFPAGFGGPATTS